MNAIFRTLEVIISMNMDLKIYLPVQHQMPLRQSLGSQVRILKKIP